MTHWKARLLSLPSLLFFSALGAGLSTYLIFPVSDFIMHTSVSVSDNFRTVAFYMGLLLVSAVPVMGLVARLIWGAAFIGSASAGSEDPSEKDDSTLDMPNMKVTGAKLGFVYVVVILIAAFALDHVGQGTLVLETQRWGVLTEMRATDAKTRRSAAEGSVRFIGDKKMTRALARILDNPGEAREWAALAAGARIDKELGDSLFSLARNGTPVERAAAVGALARIRDARIVQACADAWPHLGEYRGDVFLALSIIGKNENVLSRRDLEDAGNFIMGEVETQKLDRDLRQMAIFALNRLESPLGLVWLEGLLTTEKDLQTLCMALEALGNIGAADSSPKMIAFFDQVDPKGFCEEAVTKDFAGRQTLIRSKADIQVRALAEIAHIGDSRALKDMARISKDTRIAESTRRMAAEIAFQLQFRSSGSPL